MNNYKVLEEKYTQPSNMSQNIERLTTKILERLLSDHGASSNTVVKIEHTYNNCKRKVCNCHKIGSPPPEESLCEMFKKMRLECDNPYQSEVKLVKHSNCCKASNGACCTTQNNFGGATKSLEVNTDHFKFSNQPMGVSLDSVRENTPTSSKIPVRISRSTGDRRNATQSNTRRDLFISKKRATILKKRCTTSENHTTPYMNDIINTFPKTTKKVTFKDLEEKEEAACSGKDYRKRVLCNRPLKNTPLNLPRWRY